jgi:hypothetical protein
MLIQKLFNAVDVPCKNSNLPTLINSHPRLTMHCKTKWTQKLVYQTNNTSTVTQKIYALRNSQSVISTMPYVIQFDPTAASHRHRTEQRLANENLSFVKAHFTQAPTCCPCIQNDNGYELMHGCTQHSTSVVCCHCIEANEGCTPQTTREGLGIV